MTHKIKHLKTEIRKVLYSKNNRNDEINTYKKILNVVYSHFNNIEEINDQDQFTIFVELREKYFKNQFLESLIDLGIIQKRNHLVSYFHFSKDSINNLEALINWWGL